MQTLEHYLKYNIRSMDVFEKYGIRPDKHLDVPLSTLCIEFGLPIQQLKAELKQLNQQRQRTPMPENLHFERWPTDLLIDYVLNKYHKESREHIRRIQQQLDEHPELTEITPLRLQFKTLSHWLEKHMQQEEELLFPMLRKQNARAAFSLPQVKAEVKLLRKNIEHIMRMHDHERRHLQQLNAHLAVLNVAARSNTAVRRLLRNCNAFEEGMRMHMFIEDFFLLPRALPEITGETSKTGKLPDPD